MIWIITRVFVVSMSKNRTKLPINILRPRHNGRHCADDILKLLFVYENCCILIQMSLRFIPNQQKSSIRTDNGLLPIKQQAITFTNDGLTHWRIFASLGLNESIQGMNRNNIFEIISLNENVQILSLVSLSHLSQNYYKCVFLFHTIDWFS